MRCGHAVGIAAVAGGLFVASMPGAAQDRPAKEESEQLQESKAGGVSTEKLEAMNVQLRRQVQELRKSNDRLAERVSMLQKRLDKTDDVGQSMSTDELEQAKKRIAGMARDLRNDMRSVNGRLDRLDRRVSRLADNGSPAAGIENVPNVRRTNRAGKFDAPGVTQADVDALWQQIDEILKTLDQITGR